MSLPCEPFLVLACHPLSSVFLFHHTSILLSFVLEDTTRQYYLLANPLSPGPSSDGAGSRHVMVEQGIRLAQIDSNMPTSTKFEHAYRQTVTEDHVSNELQDLMVRYRLPRLVAQIFLFSQIWVSLSSAALTLRLGLTERPLSNLLSCSEGA